MNIVDAIVQHSPVLWEIPKTFRDDMRVSARIFATEAMLGEIARDRSLTQLVNVTTFPHIQGSALAMPDIHEGYGFPVGGVAATSYPDGVISPGGIGYDINCGVRLLTSSLTRDDIKEHARHLAKEISRTVPAGVGKGGIFRLKKKEFDQLLQHGAEWVVTHGYGNKGDLQYIESAGVLPQADPSVVSDRAKERGYDQLGTMGAGNHFVEVDLVSEIFDEAAAKILGLFQHQAVVFIHTGSRGVGHQIATDYIRTMLRSMPTYGIKPVDRELAYVPFASREGQHYFSAMAAAANFAFANRQMITWEVCEAWKKVFGGAGGRLALLYDVAHNIAKIEEHEIGGKKKNVIVHRKGATRAFPPGHSELTEKYRALGQPVLTPGSMGTASYVLLGTEGAMRQSFGSTCHGAGRRMSRSQARREMNAHVICKELEAQGILVEAGSPGGIAEEAPQAYKDIHEVVRVVCQAGIARKVAKLSPVVVVKG